MSYRKTQYLREPITSLLNLEWTCVLAHYFILECHGKPWDCDVITNGVQQQLSTSIQFKVHQQSTVVWAEKSQQETLTYTGRCWQEFDSVAAESDCITDWLRQTRSIEGFIFSGLLTTLTATVVFVKKCNVNKNTFTQFTLTNSWTLLYTRAFSYMLTCCEEISNCWHQLCLTYDSKHHASDLVADGIACNTLIASSVGSTHVLYLQIPLGTDMELATLCHLYAILKMTTD